MQLNSQQDSKKWLKQSIYKILSSILQIRGIHSNNPVTVHSVLSVVISGLQSNQCILLFQNECFHSNFHRFRRLFRHCSNQTNNSKHTKGSTLRWTISGIHFRWVFPIFKTKFFIDDETSKCLKRMSDAIDTWAEYIRVDPSDLVLEEPYNNVIFQQTVNLFYFHIQTKLREQTRSRPTKNTLKPWWLRL